MYKVILAEDEMLVRLGLMNAVKWEQYNMQVVADVVSGTEAYEKYCALKPHIIITDIKMPGMDGVELVKKIRETDSSCLILVISCLDDFFLLRDIMQYNLLGYVLKASMTMSEIEGFLNKAKKILDKNISTDSDTAPLKPVLSGLLSEYINKADVDYEIFCINAKNLGYDVVSELNYSCFTCFFVTPIVGKPLNTLGQTFIKNVISDTFCDSVVFLSGENCFVALHHKKDDDAVNSDILRVQQTVQSFLDISIRTASHNITKGISALKQELAEFINIYFSHDANSDQIIQKAIDYLFTNYNKNISLNDIADYVGLSSNYFSTQFKKETGISYVNYLNNIRIEKAKLLLQNTDDYLYKISEDVGFNNFEYFSQVFKQRAGMNLGEWRRSHRGKYVKENVADEKDFSVEA